MYLQFEKEDVKLLSCEVIHEILIFCYFFNNSLRQRVTKFIEKYPFYNKIKPS